MTIIQRMHHWNDAHPFVHLILRVALGLLLLLKGISFTSNSEHLHQLIENSQFQSMQVFLISYITFAHLIGGVFLIIGFFTRISAIIQLPILIGAVFFINIGLNSFSATPEIILAAVALILLVYFIINGSGEFSVDRYIKEHLL